MTFASYLENLGYTDAEIDETLFRLDAGMEIPQEICKDIKHYFFGYYDQKNTWRKTGKKF